MQATFAATVFDEWRRAGLTDVVLAPGSRSTPLALAAAATGGLTLHVRLDERSAAFFAVGRALASARPVAVVVTSGTAAAELHAAVAEADLARVPLVVVTADRPPELRGVGAPQTILQSHLYGPMVRLFEEPGIARAEAAATWRPLAARLYAAARGGRGEPGPVHLNAAFVEPLVAVPGELPAARAEPDGSTREAPPATGLEVAGRAVLCVVGLGVSAETVARARAADWAVVGDATVASTLAHADVVLRDDALAAWLGPEVVVRLGGAPASKALATRLASWGAPVVALDGEGPVADPDGVVTRRLAGRPEPTDPVHRGDPRYVARWAAASDAVESYLAERPDDVLDEPAVARAVVTAANEAGADLVVGSSMPVRDVEWWAPPRRIRVFANRGANGIDGVVSTALGVAAGSRAVALVGDLTYLHDVSGLVSGLGPVGGSLVLVVADNRGGGIFSFLAQRAFLAPERFETLFGTPHDHDLVAVARAFGASAIRVGDAATLAAEVAAGLAAGGLHVVVAAVPERDENVERHERLVEGACRAAGALR